MTSLKKEISERQRADEWISVDDRLPESRDDSVLVFFAKSGSIETVHIQDFFDEITAGKNTDGEQMYTRPYLQHEQNVTHWQPLPKWPRL